MTKEESFKKEQTNSKVKRNPKKKKALFIVAFLITLLLIFGVFQYFKMQKYMKNRRSAMELQKQVLVDAWKADGLSDEEIEEKLLEMQPENLEGNERSQNPLFKLHRSVEGTGRSAPFH